MPQASTSHSIESALPQDLPLTSTLYRFSPILTSVSTILGSSLRKVEPTPVGG